MSEPKRFHRSNAAEASEEETDAGDPSSSTSMEEATKEAEKNSTKMPENVVELMSPPPPSNIETNTSEHLGESMTATETSSSAENTGSIRNSSGGKRGDFDTETATAASSSEYHNMSLPKNVSQKKPMRSKRSTRFHANGLSPLDSSNSNSTFVPPNEIGNDTSDDYSQDEDESGIASLSISTSSSASAKARRGRAGFHGCHHRRFPRHAHDYTPPRARYERGHHISGSGGGGKRGPMTDPTSYFSSTDARKTKSRRARGSIAAVDAEIENDRVVSSQSAREGGAQQNRRCGEVSVAHAVYSWGRGEDGQLGLGDTNDQYQPVFIEILKEKHVAQIACGSGHTVALTERGEVFTWGRGDDGRLGHGDNGWKYVPRLVQALRSKHICQVTCGSYHTAAITKSGELFTWGGGMYGKLGHGNENGHATPCHVQTLLEKRIVQVACGSRHTVALAADSQVYTWGDKENGVSGHGDTDGHQYFPKSVSGTSGKNIWQIAACGFHTACLSRSGCLYTWGEGKFGRLGHGNEINKLLPNRIIALEGKKVTQVSCGGFHTAAILDDGPLFTWGGGEHGQLGHGDKINKMVPCVVGALVDSRVVQITCGWSHSVALTITGRVYSWGNGDHGKLGHGDTLRKSLPQLVQGLVGKHVVSVASYNEHTSALTNPEGTLAQMRATMTSFRHQMRKLVNNPNFHDVVFVVEGKPIYAHRALLSVRSDHFKTMFMSGMRESDELEIKIPHFRYPIFVALMEYLYTDHLDVKPQFAIELFVLSDMYMLERLKALCEVTVQQGISVLNAATLFRIADNADASQLRKICLDFTIRHFDGVTKTSAFKMLSREQILEVLMSR